MTFWEERLVGVAVGSKRGSQRLYGAVGVVELEHTDLRNDEIEVLPDIVEGGTDQKRLFRPSYLPISSCLLGYHRWMAKCLFAASFKVQLSIIGIDFK